MKIGWKIFSSYRPTKSEIDWKLAN